MSATERQFFSKPNIRTRLKKVIVRNRNQITLPRAYMEHVHLEQGEELEYEITDDGALVLRPVVTIPKDQAWYWSEKWQAEEKEVDEEISSGQIAESQSLEDFISDLKKL